MSALLDGLNPPQREAVVHEGGPLLVLAGAGSGKTRVLVHRIAHLIEQGARPEEIIAITFTNKAAAEMRERLEDLIGSDAKRLWASTFHSACARILRRDAHRIGYTRDFTIFDDSDQQRVMRRVLDEEGIDQKRFSPRSVLSQISDAKNRMEGPEAFAETAGSFTDEIVARCYLRYSRALRTMNGMDFDDLLGLVVTLFESDAEVRQRYQGRFRHVLVDEYQDTNRAQYLLVRMLGEPERNITVVGDDDQGIYSWRGADVRNILDFGRDYSDAHVIALEQNYRSTGHILAAANAVVEKVTGRHEKRLWTDLGDGAPVVVRACRDEYEEGRVVVQELRRAVDEGLKPSDVAVLYRTNAQSRVVEDALLREGILYQVIGGPKFYDRAEVKDLIAYLRVAVNPADLVSLERMSGSPKRGIGPGCITKILEFSQAVAIDPADALLRADEVHGLQVGQRTGLRQLGALREELRHLAAAGMPIGRIVTAAIDGSGLREALSGDDDASGGRLQNLEELVRMASQYEMRETDASLGGFLEEIALFADADAVGTAADRVTLMTMHNAKGLEYHTVLIIGAEEGFLPHSRSFEDPDSLEEERRLTYVGLTRARRRLVVTHAVSRTIYGGFEPRIPSRFLGEFPIQHIERIGGTARRQEQRASGRVIGSTRWDPPVEAPRPRVADVDRGEAKSIGLAVGDSVLHASFGEGVITRVERGGELVAVQFNDKERSLMPSAAPMRKIVAV